MAFETELLQKLKQIIHVSLKSTYWHIQMPSVLCKNRSIDWNNTVTGDNIPVCDDIWSSFHFTLELLNGPPCCCNHHQSGDATSSFFSLFISYGFLTTISLPLSWLFLCPYTPFTFWLPLTSFPHPVPFTLSFASHINLPLYPPKICNLLWLIVRVFGSVVDISHLLS